MSQRMLVALMFAGVEARQCTTNAKRLNATTNWGLASARMEGEEIGEARGLEKGREVGREEGREVGLILGRIQALQVVLGDAESTVAELETKTSAEFEQLLAELQRRMQQ